MAIEGNLEHFQLPEILQMVSAQRKTGILTVQGETDIIAISFKGGEVVAADALNQTIEEGLGQVLASQGLVDPQHFAAVSEEHETAGKRLFDLLIERDLLTRGQLLGALRLQTYRLLLQLLRWEKGEFKFYTGDEVAFEEGFEAISIQELLIRSVTDLGEEGPARLPGPSSVYEPIPSAVPVRVVGQDGEGSADDPSAVWIGPEEREVLERLDGETSASQIAGESGLGEYKVLFALYRLLEEGLAQPLEEEAPGPPPGPPPPARPSGPPVVGSEVAVLPDAAGAELPPPREEAFSLDVPEEAVAADQAEGARERPGEEARVIRPPSRETTDVGPPPRSVSEARPRPPVPERGELLARIAGGLAGLGLLVVLALVPPAILLPFLWQEEVREGLLQAHREALYRRVDRSARTYFLLEGHYPDAFEDLVTSDLLPDRATSDTAGNLLAYSTNGSSYELQPIVEGMPRPDLGARAGIAGDFLLDPEFFQPFREPQRIPLVLLD